MTSCENTRLWVTTERYYHAQILRDLFGDISLLLNWGGRGSKLGGCSSTFYPTLEEAHKALDAVHKTRLRRGYKEVQTSDPEFNDPIPL